MALPKLVLRGCTPILDDLWYSGLALEWNILQRRIYAKDKPKKHSIIFLSSYFVVVLNYFGFQRFHSCK